MEGNIMKKRRLTALGAIVLLVIVAILLLALIFVGWLFVKQPPQVEEVQTPEQIEEQSPPTPAEEQAPPVQVQEPAAQPQEQAPPVPVEEQELQQGEEPEAVQPASPQTEAEPTAPEAEPQLMEAIPSLPKDTQEVDETTPDALQQEGVAPLNLPNLPRTPATMNDEEKQAAIEAVAQDALHVARVSGQSEAAALEASSEARERAHRIFYRTSVVN